MTKEEKILLQQKFEKKFENKEIFEKQFKIFAPVVARYIEALLEISDDISPQVVENLANVKIKMCEGVKKNFSVNGCQYNQLISDFDLDKTIASIKIYTRKNEYDDFNSVDNTIRMFDELSNYPEEEVSQTMSLTNEEQYKLQWRYTKTIIHELNHACSYRKNVLFRNDDSLQFEGKIQENDLVNANIFYRRGGIEIRGFIYDENGKLMYKGKLYSNSLLHEGVTEYLAQKIFSSNAFDDYILGGQIKKSKTTLFVSYVPFYYMVSMLEISHNKLLSKTYFVDATQNQLDELLEIEEQFKKIGNVIEQVQKMRKIINNEEFYNNLLLSKAKELSINILLFANKQKIIVRNNLENYTKKEIEEFSNVYNRFLSYNFWKGYIESKCKMQNKEIFLNELEKQINERYFANNITSEEIRYLKRKAKDGGKVQDDGKRN